MPGCATIQQSPVTTDPDSDCDPSPEPYPTVHLYLDRGAVMMRCVRFCASYCPPHPSTLRLRFGARWLGLHLTLKSDSHPLTSPPRSVADQAESFAVPHRSHRYPTPWQSANSTSPFWYSVDVGPTHIIVVRHPAMRVKPTALG